MGRSPQVEVDSDDEQRDGAVPPELHDAHLALAPHWSFSITLVLLAIAFGWHAGDTLLYAAEVMAALGAVAVSPTLVALTPSVRHRRRVNPRRPHRHHHHAVRLSYALLVVAAACVVVAATVGLGAWLTVGTFVLVIALLGATLFHDRAIPVEPGHLDGWSARLSYALHSPPFAGLLLFGGMLISVLVAWNG